MERSLPSGAAVGLLLAESRHPHLPAYLKRKSSREIGGLENWRAVKNRYADRRCQAFGRVKAWMP